jgi:UDP-galactopyranose mutase
LGRFTTWRPYEHRVLAHIEGELLPIPINGRVPILMQNIQV